MWLIKSWYDGILCKTRTYQSKTQYNRFWDHHVKYALTYNERVARSRAFVLKAYEIGPNGMKEIDCSDDYGIK